MIINRPCSVHEFKREDGKPLTAEDLTRAIASIQAQGLLATWPPIHAPINGRDRVFFLGIQSAGDPRAPHRKEAPSELGGFQF